MAMKRSTATGRTDGNRRNDRHSGLQSKQHALLRIWEMVTATVIVIDSKGQRQMCNVWGLNLDRWLRPVSGRLLILMMPHVWVIQWQI